MALWVVGDQDRDDPAVRLVDVEATEDVGMLGSVSLDRTDDRFLTVWPSHQLVALERQQWDAEVHHGGQVRGDGADPCRIGAQPELLAQRDRLRDVGRALGPRRYGRGVWRRCG